MRPIRKDLERRCTPFVVSGVLIAAGLAKPTLGYTWGSYGHQQVNSAAIALLPDSDFTKCMRLNSDFLRRAAVAPDIDWKQYSYATLGLDIMDALAVLVENPKDAAANNTLDGLLNESELNAPPYSKSDVVQQIRKSRKSAQALAQAGTQLAALFGYSSLDRARKILRAQDVASKMEYAQHFFEQDALAKSSLLEVQADEVFTSAFKRYSRASGPKLPKTLAEEVGTAPWRAKQLFELAVDRLKKGQIAKALFYLGTLGHYVGDLSQPFHTTRNYDGQLYPSPSQPNPLARGIHSVFEDKIFDQYLYRNFSFISEDPQTHLWTSMEATEDRVVDLARGLLKQNASPVDPTQMIRSIVEVSNRSKLYVEPLLASFLEVKEGSSAREADATSESFVQGMPSSGRNSPMGFNRHMIHEKFMAALIPIGTTHPQMITVFELALRRLADSSALLSRIWLAAFLQAGTQVTSCKAFAFDRERAVLAYPEPTYMKAMTTEASFMEPYH